MFLISEVPLYGLTPHLKAPCFVSPTDWFTCVGVPGFRIQDGLRMRVRDSGSLSRANGAYLVVYHFLRGWRLTKRKKIQDLASRAEG